MAAILRLFRLINIFPINLSLPCYNVNTYLVTPAEAFKYNAYFRLYSLKSRVVEELGEMSAQEVRVFEQAIAPPTQRAIALGAKAKS